MKLEEIKAHCNEIGECWEWRTNARTDRHKRHPMIGKGVLVRRVAYEAAGKRLLPDRYLTPGCGNPYCIRPEHQRNLSQRSKSAMGGVKSPTRGASVARTRRAKGLNKVTPQIAAEIRSSEATGAELARRYGVDEKTIANVRQRVLHREYADAFCGMFSQLIASNESNARRTA
jgi:hypothetical protein